MKLLLFFSCAIILAHGFEIISGSNCSCGWTNKEIERISNGDRAGEFEFPMMAGMVPFESTTIFCGATIITNKHLITAAHCTKGYKPKMFGIHAGKNIYKKKILDGILNLTGNNGRALYDIKTFHEHPKYDAEKRLYDISIITLEDTFKFKQTLGPACIPSKRIDLTEQSLQIMGWGNLFTNGPQSKYLLKGSIDVRNEEECIRTYQYFEKKDKHQICTYSNEHSACQGDCGGPLFLVNPVTKRYTLVGVISYGIDCAKFRTVNTEVAYFLPWIEKVISVTEPSARTCSNNE